MEDASLAAFLAARDEMCSRIVAHRQRRFQREIRGAAFADDPSMFYSSTGDADLVDDDAPPLTFHLIYRDANGALTGRGFKLRKLFKQDQDYGVRGVCFLRHDIRMFKASRIVELTDLGTGEIFEDGLSYFKEHPLLTDVEHVWRVTPEERAFQYHLDEVIVLSLLASSDGDMHEVEIDEIIKMICFDWDEPLNEDRLRKRIRSLAPDSVAFAHSLNRLKRQPDRHPALKRTLRNVMDADGRLHQHEIDFAQHVLEQLEISV